ncbi:MAG: phosphoribosylaminoimidazolesuccinocarboxamide synthase [Cyclobacteriaceae bacterium]|nr:phosphoribosylaminoimidazolesuccinocarboxamide synthase [Cyclobacteriaceae bacterium]
MIKERKFRTKTGYCHVAEDKIILTRDGLVGNVSKVTVGNSISRILIIYGLLAAGLIYFSYDRYVNGNTSMAIFFGLIGIYLIVGIIKSRKNSATPVIDRKDIKKVFYKSGIYGLTRPRFEVEYSDHGKIKTRLILLPGTGANGQKEAEKAVQIMKEEKLLWE